MQYFKFNIFGCNLNKAVSNIFLSVLTEDVIEHHIIPLCPLIWSLVSKRFSRAAFHAQLESMDCSSLHKLFDCLLNNGGCIEALKQIASAPCFQPSLLSNQLYQIALARKDKAIIKLLLTHPKFDATKHFTFDSHYIVYSPLDYAIEEESNWLVKYMLEELNFDPAENHNGAIRTAVRARNYEFFFLLMKDKRVDPSIPTAKEETNLYQCYSDSSQVVIDEGYILTKNEPLIMASAMGDAKLVEALLTHPRVDPTSCDSRAILEAIARGHFQVVKLLLQDTRIRHAKKPVALSFLIGYCSTDMIELLKENSYF